MKINASQYQPVGPSSSGAAPGDTDAQQARALLRDMAVSLVAANGSVKSGYLKLGLVDGDHRRLGTRWSRQADGSTRDALDLVQRLVEKGYGHNPALDQALQTYLTASGGGRIGTQSFVKLVRALEAGAGVPTQAGDRLAQARVGAARLDTRALVEPRANPGVPIAILAEPEAHAELAQPVVIQEPVRELEAPLVAEPTSQVLIHDLEVPLLGASLPAEALQVTHAESAASVRLTKAVGFSVSYDGPPLELKRFNLLDRGPHGQLGSLIDGALADQGLRPPPGISRFQVNGSWVYCAFDSAGKARAMLPKGEDRSDGSLPIMTLGDFDELDEDDYGEVLNGPFAGSNTKVRGPQYVTQEIPQKILDMLEGDAARFKQTLAPLDGGGAMLVQFTLHGDPWAAELTLRPGKKVADINPKILPGNELSVRLIPLDQPFTESSISTDELTHRLPGARFDKRARVAFAHDYTGVLTTTDGAYVKKFYQAGPKQMKLPFFENLLDHDHAGPGGSPGIINRMLVGVPTADHSKTVSPPGPVTLLAKARIDAARLDEFRRAARTAVDDLLIVARAGFSMPEHKQEHFLMDPKADVLEIKMIDFGGGQRPASARQASIQSFNAAVDFLSLMLGRALGQALPKLEPAAISQFLQEFKDYAQQARDTRF